MLIPLGVAGFAGFVTWQLLVEWPGGDPGKALDAADHYDAIGKAVKSSLDDLGPELARVLKENAGKGINEFHGYMRTKLTPYADQLDAYSEKVATAYRNYANALKTVQKALITMAFENYVELLFAGLWSWTGVGVTAMTNALLDQTIRRIVAKTLIGQLIKVISETVVRWLLGSMAYALGNQVLTYGAGELSIPFGGAGPGSLHYNWDETLNNFVACLPFFGLYDVTKLGPLVKVFPHNLLGNFGSFYIGSMSYTMVYNLMEGKSLGQSVPPLPLWLTKIGVYVNQQSKSPSTSNAPGTEPVQAPASAPNPAAANPAAANPAAPDPGAPVPAAPVQAPAAPVAPDPVVPPAPVVPPQLPVKPPPVEPPPVDPPL